MKNRYPDEAERAKHVLATDMAANWERIWGEKYEPVWHKTVQMPTVTYKSEGKDVFALLSVEGKETPVVSLKLEGDSKLVIEYGEVDETGITTVSTKKQDGKNGKYIVCGRLVIVKDGKLYNSDGTVVK